MALSLMVLQCLKSVCPSFDRFLAASEFEITYFNVLICIDSPTCPSISVLFHQKAHCAQVLCQNVMHISLLIG